MIHILANTWRGGKKITVYPSIVQGTLQVVSVVLGIPNYFWYS